MIPKFRAWDKESQQMCNVGALYFSRDYELEAVSVHLHSGFVTNRNLGDCILMQSTGLKDKNGVEIYEGDVVEAKITLGHTDIGVVKFERGEFKVDDETEDILSFGFYYKFEVIGNIYENPELLEEE